MRERFHYFIMLLMVCMRNMAEFDWDLSKFSICFFKKKLLSLIIYL